MKTWSVYILRSVKAGKQPRSTYTGQTGRSVFTRLREHNNGTGAKTTKSMRPLEVFAYAGNIPDESTACRLEKAVKKQTISLQAGKSLSPAQKKCAGMAKVLARKEWMDLDLEVYVFGEFPKGMWPEGLRRVEHPRRS